MCVCVEYTILAGGHLSMLTDHVKDEDNHKPQPDGVKEEERPSVDETIARELRRDL